MKIKLHLVDTLRMDDGPETTIEIVDETSATVDLLAQVEIRAKEMDHYIGIFGEEHRKLIISALTWLNEAEPKWDLDTPIDRPKFIRNLIRNAKPE